MTCSMISTTGAEARTVMVLAVLLAAMRGWIAICGARMTVLTSCASSVASACETKKVLMTCSSYCCRLAVLSVATMMVRSFSTL